MSVGSKGTPALAAPAVLAPSTSIFNNASDCHDVLLREPRGCETWSRRAPIPLRLEILSPARAARTLAMPRRCHNAIVRRHDLASKPEMAASLLPTVGCCRVGSYATTLARTRPPPSVSVRSCATSDVDPRRCESHLYVVALPPGCTLPDRIVSPFRTLKFNHHVHVRTSSAISESLRDLLQQPSGLLGGYVLQQRFVV